MEATKKLWAVLAVSAVVAGTSIEQIEPSISAPAAKAETPEERCKRQTDEYNAAWKRQWAQSHKSEAARGVEAPPPPVPYRCVPVPSNTVAPPSGVPAPGAGAVAPAHGGAPVPGGAPIPGGAPANGRGSGTGAVSPSKEPGGITSSNNGAATHGSGGYKAGKPPYSNLGSQNYNPANPWQPNRSGSGAAHSDQSKPFALGDTSSHSGKGKGLQGVSKERNEDLGKSLTPGGSYLDNPDGHKSGEHSNGGSSVKHQDHAGRNIFQKLWDTIRPNKNKHHDGEKNGVLPDTQKADGYNNSRDTEQDSTISPQKNSRSTSSSPKPLDNALAIITSLVGLIAGYRKRRYGSSAAEMTFHSEEKHPLKDSIKTSFEKCVTSMDLSMLKKLSRAIDKIYFPLPKKNEYIRGGAVVALPTSESKIKNVDLVYPLPHKGGVTGDRWDKPPYPERYRDKPEGRTRSNLPVPKGHRPIPTGTGECGKHQYVYASVISGTDNAWVKGGKKGSSSLQYVSQGKTTVYDATDPEHPKRLGTIPLEQACATYDHDSQRMIVIGDRKARPGESGYPGGRTRVVEVSKEIKDPDNLGEWYNDLTEIGVLPGGGDRECSIRCSPDGSIIVTEETTRDGGGIQVHRAPSAEMLTLAPPHFLIDNGAPEDPNMKDPTHLQCVYGGATGNFESKGPFISADFYVSQWIPPVKKEGPQVPQKRQDSQNPKKYGVEVYVTKFLKHPWSHWKVWDRPTKGIFRNLQIIVDHIWK